MQFDANPMQTAGSSLSANQLVGSPNNVHSPRAGSSQAFGIQRQLAWDVHRGAGAAPESLNALNAGSFRQFGSSQSYQPPQ